MSEKKEVKMVTITILPGDDGAKERFVGVNEYTAKIKIGKPVKVPEYVAKMLQLREVALVAAQERSDALAEAAVAE